MAGSKIRMANCLAIRVRHLDCYFGFLANALRFFDFMCEKTSSRQNALAIERFLCLSVANKPKHSRIAIVGVTAAEATASLVNLPIGCN